jgi:hypothetical protein
MQAAATVVCSRCEPCQPLPIVTVGIGSFRFPLSILAIQDNELVEGLLHLMHRMCLGEQHLEICRHYDEDVLIVVDFMLQSC